MAKVLAKGWAPRLEGQSLHDVAHPVGKNKRGMDDFISGGSYLPMFTVYCKVDRDMMVPLNERIWAGLRLTDLF